MSKPTLKLDWCSHEAAKYACERWHYSGTIPTGKCNWIGVWESGAYIGAIIFGLGATPSLCKPYGLGVFEVCELVRVALTDHATEASRIIAIGLRMLKRKNPLLRVCVSFADPFNGHHGGIYQSGNWIHTGDSQPSEIWKLHDGRMAHPRQFTGQGWNAPKKPPTGAMLIKVPGKHRYVMPLDDEMRKRIEPLRKPYPKRAGSADSGTAGIQPEGGGATPTPALASIETP